MSLAVLDLGFLQKKFYAATTIFYGIFFSRIFKCGARAEAHINKGQKNF